MKYINPFLKKRLSIWGDWVTIGINGLGFSNETPISRLLTSPGRTAYMALIPRYFTNKWALEVQKAVDELNKRNQDILWLQYVTKVKPQLAAEALGQNKDDYLQSLSSAEQEIANILNIKYFIYT
jgi:hypothetical protein